MARVATSRTFGPNIFVCLATALAIVGCGASSKLADPPITAQNQIKRPSYLPRTPEYVVGDKGIKQDFYMLNHAEELGFKRNAGGANLTFGLGSPIVSPGNGIVASVDYHPDDGIRVTIDMGVVNLFAMHFLEVYVTEGQRVTRKTMIGREGSKFGIAHTKFSPNGTMFFIDHAYSRYGDYFYKEGNVERVSLLDQLNNLLNPDKYAQGKLFMVNWWDGVSDPDAPYWKTVDDIKADLAAFVKTYQGKAPADAVARVKSPLFTARINAFGKALADYEKRTGVDALVTDARKIVAKIKLAGTQLIFTSPFIKPGMEDQYIAWNPQHRVLIDAYRR